MEISVDHIIEKCPHCVDTDGNSVELVPVFMAHYWSTTEPIKRKCPHCGKVYSYEPKQTFNK